MIAEAEESIERMLAFWRRHRSASGVPAKRGLQLAEIKSDLRYITVHERQSPENFVYRVHGSAVAAHASTDLTGTNLLDNTPQVWRASVLLVWNAILDQPCGVREQHTVLDPVDGVVPRQGLHLPLAGDDGTALFIFSYYPPTSPRDDLPLHEMRQPDNIRKPIAVVDLAFIDLGAGLPAFADQAVRTVRQLADQVGDQPPD